MIKFEKNKYKNKSFIVRQWGMYVAYVVSMLPITWLDRVIQLDGGPPWYSPVLTLELRIHVSSRVVSCEQRSLLCIQGFSPLLDLSCDQFISGSCLRHLQYGLDLVMLISHWLQVTMINPILYRLCYKTLYYYAML